LPTVETLCHQLDVAKVTLDGALRRLEAERILVRAPRRGIFVAPTIAQKTIAVVFGGNIFSSQFSPFWTLLLRAVRQQAPARKHQPLAYLDIAQSDDGLGGHVQLVEDLENRRIHGMLLLAPHYEFDEAGQLASYGVPMVVLGNQEHGWTVTHDWARFHTFAARELASNGCRRVALLGMAKESDRALLESELRKAGYTGAPVLDWSFDRWAPHIPGLYSHETFGRELAQRMIAARHETPLPDGLVSLDDTMTHGVLHALEQAGITPGRDILIATTSNKGSPVLASYGSAIIQLEYDPATSVCAALDMLETLMNGGTPLQNPMLIEPVLVARAERRSV
jgi:DNA-binding LacI/PurR family transcriptional regulator